MVAERETEASLLLLALTALHESPTQKNERPQERLPAPTCGHVQAITNTRSVLKSPWCSDHRTPLSKNGFRESTA
jgi:hypothetical protein